MDDPTRRCENDTGICDAPSGVPGPKRGPHFFRLPCVSLAIYFPGLFASAAAITRSRLPDSKSC
jgi:hypothetical protein